jgi:hypothetical protein
MYTKLIKLQDDKIVFLDNLSNQVNYRSNNIRVGASGSEKMSIYSYSKWFDWNRIQRKEYKSCFDKDLLDSAMMGWFLKFPRNSGFLDLMTYWVGNKLAANVVSFALADQDIIINGQKITVLRGEGIKFNLGTPHEIKPSSNEMRWVCLMLLK